MSMSRKSRSALLSRAFAVLLVALPAIVVGQPPQRPGGDRPAGPPKHRAPVWIQPVTGKVMEFLKNKPGDIDAIRLDSGKLIHFPPHMGQAISEWLKAGDEVTVFGAEQRGRDELEMIEAAVLLHGDRALLIAESGPKPRGPKEGGPPKGKPKKVGDQEDDDDDNEREDGEKKLKPHEEIVRELQAIRAVLESQGNR